MVIAIPDDGFAGYVADGLAQVRGVRAVTLGGSRAAGTERPDSDWDFAVYYRGAEGAFEPTALKALGWEGEVFGIGDWGGGVFNGGAWLTVDGQRVDVHYRDLDDVEFRLAEVREGWFEVERLLFHLAGVPTYVVLAELAVNRTLRGELPRPGYPEALRLAAPARWRGDALATLGYARGAHAVRGHLADTAGAIATAACYAAHAVLAARGEWITNEKRLLERAGLRAPVDALLSGLSAEPEALETALSAAERLFAEAD
jgi:predicted nucleotidyltransferase